MCAKFVEAEACNVLTDYTCSTFEVLCPMPDDAVTNSHGVCSDASSTSCGVGNNDYLEVRFQLSKALTVCGETVRVAGDLLCGWDPKEGVRLSTSQTCYPTWHSSTVHLDLRHVDCGDDFVTIKYKYVRDQRALGGGFRWEDGIANRQVTIPRARDACHAVWVVTDQAFDVARPPELTKLRCPSGLSDADTASCDGTQDRHSATSSETRSVSGGLPNVGVRARRSFESAYELLGKGPFATGGFSQVWLCRARGDCKTPQRAVKCIHKGALTIRERQLLLGHDAHPGEIQLHSNLRHPRIVDLLEVFDCADAAHMVMEWCRGGDLLNVVSHHRQLHGGGLPCSVVASAARQLFEALAFVHSRRIVHRDVKCENLFLVEAAGEVASLEDATFKLGDFGLSAALPFGGGLRERLGSPSTVAPEVLFGRLYGTPADIWSAGALLYTALQARRPFEGAEVQKRTPRSEVPLEGAAWDAVDGRAKALLSSLLLPGAAGRPSAGAALADAWLRR